MDRFCFIILCILSFTMLIGCPGSNSDDVDDKTETIDTSPDVSAIRLYIGSPGSMVESDDSVFPPGESVYFEADIYDSDKNVEYVITDVYSPKNIRTQYIRDVYSMDNEVKTVIIGWTTIGNDIGQWTYFFTAVDEDGQESFPWMKLIMVIP